MSVAGLGTTGEMAVWEGANGPRVPVLSRSLLDVRTWATAVAPPRLIEPPSPVRSRAPVVTTVPAPVDGSEQETLVDLSPALSPQGTGFVQLWVEPGREAPNTAGGVVVRPRVLHDVDARAGHQHRAVGARQRQRPRDPRDAARHGRADSRRGDHRAGRRSRGPLARPDRRRRAGDRPPRRQRAVRSDRRRRARREGRRRLVRSDGVRLAAAARQRAGRGRDRRTVASTGPARRSR